MNKRQKNLLDSKKDIPTYTLKSATRIEAKYLRQAASLDCFAIVNLEVKPSTNKQIAIFNDRISKINLDNTILFSQQDSNGDTKDILDAIYEGIKERIKKARLNLDQKSYFVRAIEVDATYAIYHPVDSRSQCYKMTVYLTLLKVFENTKLVRV